MAENRIVKKFIVKDTELNGGFTPDFLIGSDGDCVSVRYGDIENVTLQQALDAMYAALTPSAELNSFIQKGLDGDAPSTYTNFINKIVEEVLKKVNNLAYKKSSKEANKNETVNIRDIVGGDVFDNKKWNEIMVITASIVNTNQANNRNIYQCIIPRTLLEKEGNEIILKDNCSTESVGSDRKNLAIMVSGGGGNYENKTINEHLCTWEIARNQIKIRLLNESGTNALTNNSFSVKTYFYWR